MSRFRINRRAFITSAAVGGSGLILSGCDAFDEVGDPDNGLRNVLDARGFAAVRPFTRMLYGSSARFDDAARTFAVIGPEFG